MKYTFFTLKVQDKDYDNMPYCQPIASLNLQDIDEDQVEMIIITSLQKHFLQNIDAMFILDNNGTLMCRVKLIQNEGKNYLDIKNCTINELVVIRQAVILWNELAKDSNSKDKTDYPIFKTKNMDDVLNK